MALLFSIVSSVDVQAASKYTLKTNPDKKITLAVGESCYPGLFVKYGTNERFVWFKADGSMEEYDWL